ncbi:MAG: hypothetical protein A2Z91_02650 [Deltaproteobacteria bacterium GWA2_38_16]|nr:MAG: hypothetical protein A2Z91_02650 [Deltaproteobacteria bacterium GWA2_38_16]OGQ02092.1 MAG: hypothetical protein A3D19_08945 [Deltaproteobacteria bacterium RIFCSPHIGHO2_02_FULL_38_15]OGQ32525.1 MAG: hypothetical protein A3A72_02990 [Deltaproteobacteria bacterium RIFCSPLOWO2_01_FULL_38_9]OGQ61645.1 MAG: hypothetical protein A3G92_07120 [Deltaproteobacteria bacterium RIFCSPLOWO2_12_FULL_38_8]HBQ21630.1 hypothetical protein [Deltaproteobacteria bacterium]
MEKKVFRIHYLIDRDFQLRYALLLASVAIFIAVLIGGLVFYSLHESHALLLKAGLTEHPEVKALITHWKNFLNYNLMMILAGLIIFLTLLGILITHKMVGPILVLKRKLDQIAQGLYDMPMNLRRGDEFQDVKEKFNDMLSHLQHRTQEEINTLNSILQKTTDTKTQELLKNLIQQKQKSLGGNNNHEK